MRDIQCNGDKPFRQSASYHYIQPEFVSPQMMCKSLIVSKTVFEFFQKLSFVTFTIIFALDWPLSILSTRSSVTALRTNVVTAPNGPAKWVSVAAIGTCTF